MSAFQKLNLLHVKPKRGNSPVSDRMATDALTMESREEARMEEKFLKKNEDSEESPSVDKLIDEWIEAYQESFQASHGTREESER